MKLKLFTDLNLLDKGYPTQILIPFIGLFNKEDELGSVMYGRFNEYLQEGKNYLELTSIDDCDACLLPVMYDVSNDTNNHQPEIQQFIKKAETSGKPILIFAGHDIQQVKVSIKNAIIFNSAVSRSTKPANVFSWPHFFEDYLQVYSAGKMEVKTKGKKPVVGFCGYAPPLNLRFGREKLVGFMKLIANYIGVLQKYPWKISHSYRARAILALKRSNKVVPNLKLKSNFAFGPQGQLNTGNTTETHAEFRTNFVRNIVESDYTLCVRGIGNNSVRFFETLCCGRIPVFVDTDSTLPFDHIIDWKKFCIWIEEKDIDRIGEIVNKYHEDVSEEDFTALQKRLRQLWEEYLSPVGFFKNLHLFVK
jgi:hypothetical protein